MDEFDMPGVGELFGSPQANPSITMDLYRDVLEDEKRSAVYSLSHQLNLRTHDEEESR